ncbi:MAG TPA: hypothetical protein VJO52_08960 [Gemmatimonadaceae bacterium]|nr:hypothetical protein [Gemmatimonadaceae bacterium]
MHALSFATISTVVAASALNAQKAPDLTPYLMSNRAEEIGLARSAAPSGVSEKATVLVLTTKGYTEAAVGTNGFTCLVLRSFTATPGDKNFWNARLKGPACFNPPASHTVLPAMMAQVDWMLTGATAAELNARMKKAYADKRFTTPADGAMAYMLSPQQYLSDDDPHRWMPHLMFYYDRALKGTTFGAGGYQAPIIDASVDDPNGPVEVLYIPMLKWSDGTSAVRATSGS